jgi:hypothetical protein
LQYGATADDLQNFPGMANLVAGSGVTLTPGTGTLTASVAWIGTTSGATTGSATTTLSADSTWYDIGASVSLAAGTYWVTSFAQAFMRTTAGTGKVTTRLYNVTGAAAITNSECLILGDDNVTRRYGGASTSCIVTVASTSTIRLEASRLAGATYTTTTILSDATGRSGIAYVRIY